MHSHIVRSIYCSLLFLTGCATPQSRIERDPTAFAALTTAQQERVKKGEVTVGFDEATVRLALGEPDRIIERETSEGISQSWVYYAIVPDSYNAGYCAQGFPYYSYRYYCRPTIVTPTQYEERMRLVFKDGKVSSVERAK